MARPVKSRIICAMPENDCFGPVNKKTEDEIELSLEEYETIRLIDLLGYTQEECGGQMGVARTTVQSVYNSAREKLADALVNGRQLHIGGGNYELCPESHGCCKKHCRRFQGSKGVCGRKKTGGCSDETCGNV